MFGYGLFQSLNAEAGVHSIGQTLGQHLVPVHDRNQVEELAPNRNGGDVGAPDLTRTTNDYVFQQIGGINSVRRMRLAGSQPFVYGLTPHHAHQPSNTVTPVNSQTLPCADLIRMHLMLRSDLLNVLLSAPQGFKRHLRLKLIHKVPSFRHVVSLSQVRYTP